MDLGRRELQRFHDVRIPDPQDLVDRLSLDPLGRETGAGDRAAASERLELRLLDHPPVTDPNLKPDDVAALGRADKTRTHPRVTSVHAPRVPGMVAMLQNLLAVRHFPTPKNDQARADPGH